MQKDVSGCATKQLVAYLDDHVLLGDREMFAERLHWSAGRLRLLFRQEYPFQSLLILDRVLDTLDNQHDMHLFTIIPSTNPKGSSYGSAKQMVLDEFADRYEEGNPLGDLEFAVKIGALRLLRETTIGPLTDLQLDRIAFDKARRLAALVRKNAA